MNLVYEEGGDIKVASILSEAEQSLQVEAPHGKRSKIKAASVLARFSQPAPAELWQQADALKTDIDVDLLWSAVPPEAEMRFDQLAGEYFGRSGSLAEQLAVLLRLHEAPVYFHRRPRGHFRAAAETNLKAALAGLERKRQQEQQKTEALDAIDRGEFPHWMQDALPALLYHPDKNTLAYKTLEAAAVRRHCSHPEVLVHCGVLRDSRDWHEGRFEFEYFGELPDSVGPVPVLSVDHLPLSAGWAFSIDDANTTEIDDAFSVTPLDAEHDQIGIHIAAPALGIGIDARWGTLARERLSTVYMPGRKLTMLPGEAIRRFSLDQGANHGVLSLLLTVRRSDGQVVDRRTRIERIEVRHNLRLHEIESEVDLTLPEGRHPCHDPLHRLWQVSERLALDRGARDKPSPQYQDFNFEIDPTSGRVTIEPRPRGAPLDSLVAELMIEANTTWAGQLSSTGTPALFRIQGQGRTGTDVLPGPHLGLGVPHYAWCTSPLRRYVDLVNQWQLCSLHLGIPTVFATVDALSGIAQAFDQAYEAYAEFQRQMERYWSLRWLIQENLPDCSGATGREGVVRFFNLPLAQKFPSAMGLAPGTGVLVQVASVDLWGLDVRGEALPGATGAT